MKIISLRLMLLSAALAVSLVAVMSCGSAPPAVSYREPLSATPENPAGKPVPPLAIMGAGKMSESRLVSFFLSNNPKADRAKVTRMAGYYIDEGALEGVNADVAFVQMCLETGFLRFGGDVTESMNNFCGLGTVGGGQAGASFPDERTGVRAHVQHLKAYASTEPLRGAPVDPRYKYVNPKGQAPLVQGLSGTWAADRGYGTKLAGLLAKLYA